MKEFVVVILAAGYGSRLKSSKPKVLNEVNGMKMIHMIINTVLQAGAARIVVVVGYKSEEIVHALINWPVELAYQNIPRGTGDAMKSVYPILKNEKRPVVVLCGDVPLITSNTIKQLVIKHVSDKNDATILTSKVDEPSSYGRIIYNEGKFEEVIEESDCDVNQLKVKDVNTGTYCFNGQNLWRILPNLKRNDTSNEYYITDVLKMFRIHGFRINTFETKNSYEIRSVNTPKDLDTVNEIAKWCINTTGI